LSVIIIVPICAIVALRAIGKTKRHRRQFDNLR
jgi:hypothetical protein